MDDSKAEMAIVEDDPGDAELILRILKEHDPARKAIVLKNGAEALEFFLTDDKHGGGTSNPSLKVILLDLNTSSTGNIEILRQIRSHERTRSIPVVVLTSSVVDQELKEAYDLGANSCVSKPVESEKFIQTVAQIGLYWLSLNKIPTRFSHPESETLK